MDHQTEMLNSALAMLDEPPTNLKETLAKSVILAARRKETEMADLQKRDETPADGYGAGFIEYSIRTSFRDLCRLIGFENARNEVAEIINSEASRKRITIDG